MGEGAIKLFGLTIPLPPHGGAATTTLREEEPRETEKAADPSSSDPVPCPEHPKADSGDKGEDEPSNRKEKEKVPLKKPDKILPCPRCSSMDTKFCYYNNYNINQPRHFCKDCQRYWTDGGTMRNVPVGAGRRKHKSSTHQSLHRVHPAGSEPSSALTNNTSTTILAFGQSRIHPTERMTGSCATSSADEEWHSEEGKKVALSNSVNASSQQLPVAQFPAYFTPGFAAIPIDPAAAAAATAYWGCMLPGAWGIPWPPVQAALPSSPPAATSTALGKHLRDSRSENGVIWTPKTIRIDDPEAAAKSSIWSMFAVKDDKACSLSGGKLAMVFDPKVEKKSSTGESALALHSNPAATARSMSFQEGN